ncbi:G-box-binding factor [Drosophila grimshawi]|uniref:GH14095 n=1 Tax=Drosophila grimshawi TaxID=7222 RepID=B4JY33_DROGR|nr:G-box-binding factor [Drosophila grimshawi]EDV90595.1 GH14095 [Drosophila grimshawi]
MINGKFYTGLPPKMVERECGNGRNRQESHFFWPDDTRVDSALETRVKRRNSLQLETERPRVGHVQRVNSFQADASMPEVDTRQMFHKEFAKSSIQFYDNLQPSQGNSSSTSSNNRSRLPCHRRREVTPKLTDVDTVPRPQPLPPIKDVDEIDPSAAKRKQAYSSTIQFYDYVNGNEGKPTQNNTRRPKMDMNNKREMELNSKNSPKLQVKHNVRHLSVEREQQLPPLVTKKPLNDGQQWQREQYEPIRRVPKKILKQPPIEVVDDVHLDYVENGMRLLRVRSPKHVTYNEEAAEYAYYEPDERQPRQLQPNMRTGSGQQQQQHKHQQHQQQQQTAPYEETGRDIKSLNNYNKKSHNNYNEYSNNNNSSNNHDRATRKVSPKILPETTMRTMRAQHNFDDTRATSATTAATVAAAGVEASSLSLSDPRKHLRSSLCFNGDALVVDVGATAVQSTSKSALARRSSAGQRVSVGLPD